MWCRLGSVQGSGHSVADMLLRLGSGHRLSDIRLGPLSAAYSTNSSNCSRPGSGPALCLRYQAVRCDLLPRRTISLLSRDVCADRIFTHALSPKYYSSQAGKPSQGSGEVKKQDGPQGGVEEAPLDDRKLSLWQRFKKMYKEYWYVLVPVHVVTSIGWFGSFYYAAICGVDIIPYLEMLGTPERMISIMKNSGAGYVAVAYAMYKVATPLRYTVTLGGTTVSINYLKKWGLIQPKPIPSKEEFRLIMKEKGEEFQERTENARLRMGQFTRRLRGRRRNGQVHSKSQPPETRKK